MPIYEYSCEACGERFEALRPVESRDKPLDCPKCGHNSSEKLLSVFAAGGGCGPSGGSGGFT